MKELTPYDEEVLEPEDMLAEGHPANDQYLQNQKLMQQQIVDQSNRMTPVHVMIVKHHHTGLNNKAIAHKLGITPTTVSRVIKSPKGQRLKTLLAFYQHGIEGPTVAQRKNMLWRMAVKNEDDRPTVSKECIAELNRMDTIAYDREHAKQGSDGKIEIIINENNKLTKSELDQ